MFKYYRSAAAFTAVALIASYFFGGVNGLIIASILGVMETSLSFDNAIINASVLKNWDDKWRQRFLVWGMPIAVFGMRLVFPLLIVAIASGISPWSALTLAINTPSEYQSIITSVHTEVAAFGGIFLFMVFVDFFCSTDKDVHWIPGVEHVMSKLGKLGIETALALVVLVLVAQGVDPVEQLSFIKAGVWGLVTYSAAQALGSLTEQEDATSNIIKQGVAGLLYLELVDASFSFDGVIASFALTNDIFIMMLGLSIGAMFVRSMTLHLVDKNTLANFKYLEHSAFWAIGVLAGLMFAQAMGVHLSEVITGLVGAGLIGVGLITSIISKK